MRVGRLPILLLGLWPMAAVADPTGAPRTLEDCPKQTSIIDLERTTSALVDAYGQRDAQGVHAAAQRLRDQTVCVNDRLSPQLAADLHLAFGLDAFLLGDDDAAKRAFAASRQARGESAPTPPVIPADPADALRNTWVAIPAAAAQVEQAPPVKDGFGALLFDGRVTTERPADRPLVFQYLDRASVTRVTAYLPPGAALPSYPREAAASAGMSPTRKAAWWTFGAGMLATAGAVGAGSYYWYTHDLWECGNDGSGLDCALATGEGDNPSTTGLYDAQLRPAQLIAWTSAGVGAALLGTSTVLFVRSRPGQGTAVGLTVPW